MKIVFIIQLSEYSKGGLYFATIERIKSLINQSSEVSFEIWNLCYENAWYFSLLNRLIGRHKKKFELSIDNVLFRSLIVERRGLRYHLFGQRKETKSVLMKLANKCHNFINDINLFSAHFGDGPGEFAFYLNQTYKLKYAVTYHGSDIHTTPLIDNSFFTLKKNILENADLNIFVSNGLMEKAFDLFNVIKNPIVIPNSIDQSWMNLQFSKPNFNILGDFDGYTIAFIGNLVQVKNVLIIPDILERLSVYTNKKYRCVIIGDGPLKRELEYRFSKITGKVKVQYVNKVDREICIGLYKFIDIVLLPSFNEGLSMTLLESQAAGVRCIASDIPANRELIDSEFLVKLGENDVDEFAKRISLCFNMPKPDPYIRPQFRSENTSKLELLQYLAVLRN